MTVLFLLGSCGNETEANTDHSAPTEEVANEEEEISVSEELEETESEEEEEEIISKYNYDLDWNTFKEAVFNKDVIGMSSYAGSDEIDSEELLMFLSDEPYLDILENTTYEDLKVVEQDGEAMLEFSASETGVDEDGNEVGSAVMLYFSQGDPSLVLEYYLVAG